MRKLRNILFWMHLTAGVSAGVVIFIMSVTGAALALQPQILNFVDRDVRFVDPGVAGRLSSQAIVERASAAKDGATPTGLTLDSRPEASALVAFGQAGGVYVDPYTGAVLGEGSSSARAFFRSMTDWHRWLGQGADNRTTTKAITGASNLAFLGLAMSGLYLWWPRQWTPARLRAVTVIDPRLSGKARDFNWHNSIGFWCAPVLIVLTLTATVISYPWASNLVYRITGSPLPNQGGGPRPEGSANAPRAEGGARSPREERDAASANAGKSADVDLLVARAAEVMPTWGIMTFRFPPRANGPVSVTMSDAESLEPVCPLPADAQWRDSRYRPMGALRGRQPGAEAAGLDAVRAHGRTVRPDRTGDRRAGLPRRCVSGVYRARAGAAPVPGVAIYRRARDGARRMNG